MEKETVRTRVMLARGDQTPIWDDISICSLPDGRLEKHTAPKSMETLGLVGMADTVGEGVELVAILGE